MKLKSLVLLLLPATVMLMASCEGNTDRTWKMQNRATSTVTVTATDLFLGSEIAVEIAPGSVATLTTHSQRGGSDHVQTPTETFSAFAVINAAGDASTKDYAPVSNWQNDVERVSRVPSGYEHEYIFTVQDSDF